MSEVPFDPVPPPPLPPPEPPIPWEDRSVPFWSGLFQTVGLFLTDPTQAFRRTPPDASIGRPLAYFLGLGVLGSVAVGLYGIFFEKVMQSVLPQFGGGDAPQLPAPFGEVLAWVQSTPGRLAMIAISPVLLLIRLVVGAGIVHLALLAFGGARRGFLATVRAYAYSGTVALVLFVPVCGGVAASIWFIVLFILGLGILHGCGSGKAALAVLVPLLFCCACFAAAFALAVGAGALSAFVGAH